jgi:hypothetical protein
MGKNSFHHPGRYTGKILFKRKKKHRAALERGRAAAAEWAEESEL